ncbi:MAG: transglutaminase domain-containing protein, partial [Candidatus Cloacimonadaceae bacterium]
MRRMRFAIVLLLALLCLGLEAKDALYKKLYSKAQDNLKNMPTEIRKDYTKLLKKHKDRVMAFLLAYEESGRLAAVSPAVVENHWRSVKELMQEQGIKTADEFFLSYVAKITVSDEAISDYRRQFEGYNIYDSQYMFKGLNLKTIRKREQDPIELYRKMCLISTELLAYQPTSGRDLSPMDIAAKSLSGRCEESQILFVALCRTVGIPARPASTPWWAHQDDNHAWAEVFLNGQWYYSGDSDGGYWVNQTWFSALTGKMVLITAGGTLPAEDDEVLAQDKFGAVINSIKYYAGDKVRKINVNIVDRYGKPLAGAVLGIDVYNYYTLRPQAFTKTDEEGKKTFTAGQGAFYIMAFKDSLAALQFVPSSDQMELSLQITLNKSYLTEQYGIMHYPRVKPEFKDAPQEWKDDVAAAKARRQQQLDYMTELTSAESFKSLAEMENMQFLAHLRSLLAEQKDYPERHLVNIKTFLNANPDFNLEDSLFFQVLQKTRLNPDYFMDFAQMRNQALRKVVHTDSEPFQKWLSVLLANDEKDLWQADSWLYYRMYKWFDDIFEKVKFLPDEALLNLFDPTVFYENLPWMSFYCCESEVLQGLYPDRMKLKTPADPAPQQVAQYVAERHDINPEKALTGLIPLDIALYQKDLTSYQYKILACAYFRANRIPANYTRIPNVIAVYVNGGWHYFDLSKNDFYEMEKGGAEETRQVVFKLSDSQGQPVHLKPEQIHICFLKDGQFYAANEQTEYKGSGLFEAKVPAQGVFYAQIGYRSGDSLTVYYLKPLSADGVPVNRIDLTLEHYAQKWLAAEDIYSFIITELEARSRSLAVLGDYS